MVRKRKEKKQPRSPLKKVIKSKLHGYVKKPGKITLENMEKRAVLKFLKLKHPEMKAGQMIRYTGFSRGFISEELKS